MMANPEHQPSRYRFRISRFSTHWPLLIVLLVYISMAAAHSLAVPLTTGNDEWAHFLYIRFIAEHDRLPATIAERDEAGYKSDAPPLYHLIVAGVTSGLEPTRQLRPLDSPRRYLADNRPEPYALVHTAAEMPPFQGEVLLWYLGRGVSIFFGLVLIGLTYLTGLELFTRRQALLAAAVLAFTPAFIFHSSVLSYESLSAALTAMFLLGAIKAIKQPGGWGWWLVLGILAGLSITTKYSAVLLPLEIIFIVWLAARRASRPAGPEILRFSPLSTVFMAALGLLLAVSWWFGFIIWNFNTVDSQGPVVGVLQPVLVGDASDTTSVRVAAFLFGEGQLSAEARPPLVRNYGQLLQKLIDSFWAAPVAGRFELSPWPALLFTLLALVGLAGIWPVWQNGTASTRTWLGLLLFHSSLIIPLLLVRILFSFDPREAVQGRHLLLPAASAIPILLVWGWDHWSPRLAPAVIGGLLLWTLLGQLGWAAVTYPEPIPVWSETDQIPAGVQSVDESWNETIRLVAFERKETAAADSLKVTLWWQAVAPAPEDYLVELALLDRTGRLVGYTLGHPVQGRYPTRAWEAGDLIRDTHWLPLDGAGAGEHRLQVRLLDRSARPLAENKTVQLDTVSLSGSSDPPGEVCQIWHQDRPASDRFWSAPYRLRASVSILAPEPPRLVGNQSEQEPLVSRGTFHIFIVGPDWPDAYQVMIGSETCGELRFAVPARNFTVPAIPHRLETDFNNEIRLLGYDLPARRIPPGGRLPLTLYWQALDYMGEDYRMFDNLLDAEQRRWGGYDRRARDGYSTLQWVPGEVIIDAFGVPVDPAAPDGVYTIDIGWYRTAGGGAVPLPVTVEGQPIEQTSLRLGPVKVGGPPPEVMTTDPAPQVKLNQSFGSPGQISLLGYSGPEIQNSDLGITLFWEAETIPATDYTIFLHLRNEAGETVAQKDRPPADGRYPTSLWDPGEIIVDRISLSLGGLPPGEYSPVIGLYEFSTGNRLPVGDSPATELYLESVTLP
jgi:hypothetical protein